MGPSSCIHLHRCVGVSTAYHESGHHHFWAQVFRSFGCLHFLSEIWSLLFLFFTFIVMHCNGGSWSVMTHLSANLAEKMRFLAYRRRNRVEWGRAENEISHDANTVSIELA